MLLCAAGGQGAKQASTCLKIAALGDTALNNGLEMQGREAANWRVNTAFYSGHPALRPAGQLTLFKSAPGGFVAHCCLVSSALAVFETGSRKYNDASPALF